MSLLALLATGTLAAQENTAPKTDADFFYSGTVAEFSKEKVIVARAILGKPAEKRTFLLNADTKIEGKLKAKSRVTVRFGPSDDGDVALSILVRDGTRQDKKKYR